MSFIAALVLCLFAVLFGSFAHADAPVISLQGGCIAPSAPNENIRLDVMRVTFRSKRDSYSVDARYDLFNTGETTTVTVGVPKYGRPDRDEEYRSGEPTVRDFIGFDAWVNGRKAAFVEVPDFFTEPSARPFSRYCRHPDWPAETRGPAETRWMTKRVTFTGKGTTAIRVRYEAYYRNHYVYGGIGDSDSGYYHDSVGRYWKDRIKKATFVLDTTDIRGTELEGYSLSGLVAFTNFISVDEIREWEPSPWSFRLISGSSDAAKWRRKGYKLPMWSAPFERGDMHDVYTAPRPCNLNWEEWARRVLRKK